MTDLNQYYYSACAYNDGELAVKGMGNLGNTCYMNAALQALLSSNILNSRIIRYTQHHPDQIYEMSPMLFEYVKLIYQLIDPNRGDDEKASEDARQKMRAIRQQNHIIPRDFKDTLGKENPRFSGYHQEDAQELIEYLLSDFTELPVNLRSESQKDLKIPTEFTSIRKVLRDTYFGTYVQIIKCRECGMTKSEAFNHTDIIVPVPQEMINNNQRRLYNNREFITIADCFKKYCEIEVFDGNNKIDCDDCTKRDRISGKIEPDKTTRTKSTKKMGLDYVPELTIVTINRFKAQLTKIHEPIRIFPKIDLDGYPLRLIATVNHSGASIHGGHYTAYVSRSHYNDNDQLEEKWYLADDSSIREINKNDMLSDSRIYLALYERIQKIN
jgi:ubiquitin C-terminal hydrolase